jgi:hypothetical protein
MAVDSANALTAVSTFSSVCGLADDDVVLVEKSIDAASYWFNTVSGFKIKQRALTEYHDGDGTVTLFLKQKPVVAKATASVVMYIDTDRGWGSDTLYVQDTDYVVYEDAGKIVLLTTVFPAWPLCVKILYTAGYSPVPYDIEMAAIRLARFWYEGIKNGSVSKSSMTTGAGTTGYRRDIPDDVMAVAENYGFVGGMA